VAIGGLFAGESMFHRATDASKVALVGLVEILRRDGEPRRLLDVQWATPHLAGLGAVELPAAEYRRRLSAALDVPLPAAFR
jgi:leucyl/phenylalanyl-tRNA--protein transferase